MRDQTTILAMTLSVALLAAPGAVASKPALQDVPSVENGLFAVAVADKIRRECPDISARFFKATRFMQSLRAEARALGYTEAEIETHVSSDAQKARMRGKRDAYLTQAGVVKSDPSTYCAAGRAEINTSSQIGVLLKAR